MTIALITATGIVSRMHLDIPKQFICVDNKTIIFYTPHSPKNKRRNLLKETCYHILRF